MARSYGKWEVTLPDEKYEFDFDDITVGDLYLIESELPDDMTFDEWIVAINARKARPCQVLVWFLRRRDGRQEDIGSVDFPIRKLDFEPIPDLGELAGPEAPAGSEPATS